MARIKDSSVRDVVAVADMVEVVSGRTQLRRASGTRFTGRCPFHEEKTPSFSVNPVDKLYYCFGCGKGGDLISFVRETESLDFVGAVEWLAERFRVPPAETVPVPFGLGPAKVTNFDVSVTVAQKIPGETCQMRSSRCIVSFAQAFPCTPES